jgi:hypothetical protein
VASLSLLRDGGYREAARGKNERTEYQGKAPHFTVLHAWSAA